jgi:hypothetical protein
MINSKWVWTFPCAILLSVGLSSCKDLPTLGSVDKSSEITTPSPGPGGSPSPGPSVSPSPSPVKLGDILMYPTYRTDRVVSNFSAPFSWIQSSSYSVCGQIQDQVVCKGEFEIFGYNSSQSPTGEWISVLEGVPTPANLLMDSHQRVAAVSGNTLYYRGNVCAGFPLLGVYSPGKAFPTGARFVFPDTIKRAGLNHRGTFVVLLKNGSAYYFGDNRVNYQVPNNTASTCVSTPVKLTEKDVGGSPITDVALNSEGGMILNQKGELYSYGSNRYGQVGNNRISSSGSVDPAVAVSKPIQIPFPAGNPVLLIPSQGYTPGIIDARGRLFMMGFDYSGQSCNGTAGAYLSFNAAPAFSPPDGSFLQAVVSGGSHTMLLTKNSAGANSLYACGSNVSGMFGNGTLSGSNAPKSVPMPAGQTQVIAISVAERNTYLLTGSERSSVLFSAGNNDKAQISSPTTDSIPNWVQVQVQGAR